ncbi:MAG: hypothetical protein M1837_005224 [Sclerophora amabilis]|nr:MAG: hypothetical protein M1837_005224 [Sclerophora amabilis]
MSGEGGGGEAGTAERREQVVWTYISQGRRGHWRDRQRNVKGRSEGRKHGEPPATRPGSSPPLGRGSMRVAVSLRVTVTGSERDVYPSSAGVVGSNDQGKPDGGIFSREMLSFFVRRLGLLAHESVDGGIESGSRLGSDNEVERTAVERPRKGLASSVARSLSRGRDQARVTTWSGTDVLLETGEVLVSPMGRWFVATTAVVAGNISHRSRSLAISLSVSRATETKQACVSLSSQKVDGWSDVDPLSA